MTMTVDEISDFASKALTFTPPVGLGAVDGSNARFGRASGDALTGPNPDAVHKAIAGLIEAAAVPVEYIDALRDCDAAIEAAKLDAAAAQDSMNRYSELLQVEEAAAAAKAGESEPDDIQAALDWRAAIGGARERVTLARERLQAVGEANKNAVEGVRRLGNARNQIIRGIGQRMAGAAMPSRNGPLGSLVDALAIWAMDQAAYPAGMYEPVKFGDFLVDHFGFGGVENFAQIAGNAMTTRVRDELAADAMQSREAA